MVVIVMRDSIRKIKLLLVLFVLILLFLPTHQAQQLTDCHYSCKKCLENYYDNCTQCNEGYSYHETIKTEILIRYGLCSGIISMEFSPLGLVMLAAYVLIFWYKNKAKQNQAVFMAICWIQSLAMLSFLPISVPEPLSLVLQSFTPFMFFTMLQKTYKLNQKSQNLLADHQYRLEHFLGGQEIDKNILILGPVIILVILYVILNPLFIFLRKSINREGQWRRCSQSVLKKIESIFYVVYFFIIQEAYIVFFISLRYTNSTKSIVLTVVFMATNIFMMINYFIKPIPYFPNKKVQFIAIIQRVLMPLMLFLSPKAYKISIPVILLLARLSQTFLNNKEYNMKSQEKRKYFSYLALIILVIIFVGIFIFLQSSVEGQNGARVMSYLSSAIIVLLYGMTLGLQIFQVIYDYFKRLQQEENIRNILIRQQSTKMHLNTQGTNNNYKSSFQIELQIQNDSQINLDNKQEAPQNRGKNKLSKMQEQYERHESSKKLTQKSNQWVSRSKRNDQNILQRSDIQQVKVEQIQQTSQENQIIQESRPIEQAKEKKQQKSMIYANQIDSQLKTIESANSYKTEQFFKQLDQNKSEDNEQSGQGMQVKNNSKMPNITPNITQNVQNKISMKKHRNRNKTKSNRTETNLGTLESSNKHISQDEDQENGFSMLNNNSQRGIDENSQHVVENGNNPNAKSDDRSSDQKIQAFQNEKYNFQSSPILNCEKQANEQIFSNFGVESHLGISQIIQESRQIDIEQKPQHQNFKLNLQKVQQSDEQSP